MHEWLSWGERERERERERESEREKERKRERERESDVRAPPQVAPASIVTHLARQGVQTMAFRQDQMYASLLELSQLRSPAADRQLQLLQDSSQSLTRQSQQWNWPGAQSMHPPLRRLRAGCCPDHKWITVKGNHRRRMEHIPQRGKAWKIVRKDCPPLLLSQISRPSPWKYRHRSLCSQAQIWRPGPKAAWTHCAYVRPRTCTAVRVGSGRGAGRGARAGSGPGANASTSAAADDNTAVRELPAFITPACFSNSQWGNLTSDEFSHAIMAAYSEAVHWERNIFLVPSVSVGKEFIQEMARIFEAYAEGSQLELFTLTAAMTMPLFLLQKPHKEAKTSDNVTCSRRRLGAWKSGNVDGLVLECRASSRMSSHPRTPPEEQPRKGDS